MKHIVVILLLVATFPSQVIADRFSWEKAIEAVEKKQSKYFDYALEQGAGFPGSALQGIGYGQHICAIVGRMLGFRKEIKAAKTIQDPPLSPDTDPNILMEHTMLLDSWVSAANNAVSMTKIQKQNLWNLECVGQYEIPHEAIISDASLKGDFSVKEDTILVYGDINTGFFKRFKAALNANPNVRIVALGSAGGSVKDAIKAGLEIRQRGLSTTLHGPCFSACPLIFAGGDNRIIWMGPGPHLRFHQVYSQNGAIPLNSEVYNIIAQYLEKMGVSSSQVINWMANADPTEIFEPKLELLCVSKLATWVQRTCTAD